LTTNEETAQLPQESRLTFDIDDEVFESPLDGDDMTHDHRPSHLVFAQRVSAIDGKGQATLVSSYQVG
jgi:hypothetical protein